MTYTPPMPKATDDVIDSRDVIHWLDALSNAEERDDAEQEAWEFLSALAQEADGTPDWEYGEQIISDSYFTEYQREGLIDCGYLPKDLPGFIERNIDWDRVAEELKADYIGFSVDGYQFWVRA